jgi:hypothetical protein
MSIFAQPVLDPCWNFQLEYVGKSMLMLMSVNPWRFENMISIEMMNRSTVAEPAIYIENLTIGWK